MLPTTVDLLRAGLKSDPTVPPAQRNRLVEFLRRWPEALQTEAAKPTEPRMVRRSEAAQRLSVSLRTVDKLAKAGILRKRKLPGRVRASGFLESELSALIAQ
jgi:predicted DNA-binding transcriptional regulator AlpA